MWFDPFFKAYCREDVEFSLYSIFVRVVSLGNCRPRITFDMGSDANFKLKSSEARVVRRLESGTASTSTTP